MFHVQQISKNVRQIVLMLTIVSFVITFANLIDLNVLNKAYFSMQSLFEFFIATMQFRRPTVVLTSASHQTSDVARMCEFSSLSRAAKACTASTFTYSAWLMPTIINYLLF